MRTRKPLNPMEADLLGESWTNGIKIGPGGGCNTSFRLLCNMSTLVRGVGIELYMKLSFKIEKNISLQAKKTNAVRKLWNLIA